MGSIKDKNGMDLTEAYPGLNVPLHRRQGFGVVFHTHPGSQASSQGEAKTPVSSQVATGISWSPLSGLCSVGEL